jgi:hypothetical protein
VLPADTIGEAAKIAASMPLKVYFWFFGIALLVIIPVIVIDHFQKLKAKKNGTDLPKKLEKKSPDQL